MWKILIGAMVIAYCMIAMSVCPAALMTKVILRGENVPALVMKTIDKVVLTILAYSIPVVGMAICMVHFKQAVVFIAVATALSLFPVLKYVIKQVEIAEKELGTAKSSICA